MTMSFKKLSDAVPPCVSCCSSTMGALPSTAFYTHGKRKRKRGVGRGTDGRRGKAPSSLEQKPYEDASPADQVRMRAIYSLRFTYDLPDDLDRATLQHSNERFTRGHAGPRRTGTFPETSRNEYTIGSYSYQEVFNES